MVNEIPSPVSSAPSALSATDTELKELLIAKKKIDAIKLLRERQGLGLKEAKDYVERLAADQGIPEQKASGGFGCAVIFLLFGGVALLMWIFNLGNPPTATSTLSDAECRQTLQCWAEKHNATAAVRCRRPVEMLAKNSFEWTDGALEPKFSHYRWKNQATGEVTYIGDKIKYQNGFGAWIFHTYECDLDASGEQVTDVRASPGQIRQ